MKLESISAIIETLNAARVRYLVVGGLRWSPTAICGLPTTWTMNDEGS